MKSNRDQIDVKIKDLEKKLARTDAEATQRGEHCNELMKKLTEAEADKAELLELMIRKDRENGTLEFRLAEANATIVLLNNSVREFSESSCKKGKKLALAKEIIAELTEVAEVHLDHTFEKINKLNEQT